jgi:hypothetical protein
MLMCMGRHTARYRTRYRDRFAPKCGLPQRVHDRTTYSLEATTTGLLLGISDAALCGNQEQPRDSATAPRLLPISEPQLNLLCQRGKLTDIADADLDLPAQVTR